MRIRSKLGLLCGAVAIAAANPIFADEFQGLGTLPGRTISFANGLSADGSLVVGFSADANFHHDAATLWRLGAGIVSLGVLFGTTGSWAEAVSADGTVVVGESGVEDLYPFEQAFQWTQTDGIVALGHLPGDTGSAASAVSGDGKVIVGLSIGNGTTEAFRWTQAGGMVGLGHLQGHNQSDATGTSTDGSVVVGESYFYGAFAGPITIGGFPLNLQLNGTNFNSTSNGPPPQAFRWTFADGMVGLGFLPYETSSTANAVSADGKVIVGSSGNRAFRWTQSGGMVGLGSLYPIVDISFASGVSSDGSVVVGMSIADGGGGLLVDQAFRWTNAQGMRSVASLLTEDGVGLGAWKLESATAVSADGSVILGTGTDPGGNFEAWIAKIGTGFLSVAALNASLQSVGSVPQIDEQAANADLDDALNTALQLGLNGFDGPVGAWDAWSNFGGRQFDVAGERDTEPYGAVGFGYRPSEAWRIGAGAHWGTHALDLPILNGRAEGDLWGLSASAAFEPGAAGPRAYAAAAADWPSTDITRGYLNGITPDKSGGTREGRAYGGAIELGWLLPVTQSLSLMPFASYEATKLDLDPYTEASGAFPAHFDEIDHTTQITHAGAELRASIGSTINLWCEADWAHRFDKAVDVTGEVIALNSPFDVPAANRRANWAEGSIGAGLLLAPGIQAQLRLGAAETGASIPKLSGSLGVSVRL